MKRLLHGVIRIIPLLTILAWSQTPVNTASTQRTREVLNYLYQVRNQNKILSGQQCSGYGQEEPSHINNLVGAWPAIIGQDWLFGTNMDPGRRQIVSTLINYTRAGGLVTLCWHQTNPKDAVPDNSGWTSVQSVMTQIEFDSMVTPGTNLYNKWLAHVDLIAGYMKTLRDSGVVILWRPYHEMNGGWFWWGAKTGSSFKRLWANMYNRLTTFHQLNNLIWVWGPNTGVVDTTYFPSPYVDVGGVDIYVQTQTNAVFTNENTALSRVMGQKIWALTETGLVPNSDTLALKTDYVWFLPWHTRWCDNVFYGGLPTSNGPGNSPAQLATIYNHPATITRNEVVIPPITSIRAFTRTSGRKSGFFFTVDGRSLLGPRPKFVLLHDVQMQTSQTAH